MGAAPSRDDTVMWKGYPTPKECNEEWAQLLYAYYNVAKQQQQKQKQQEHSDLDFRQEQQEIKNLWQSLNSIEKKRLMYQFMKGDTKIEELFNKYQIIKQNNNNNNIATTFLSKVLPAAAFGGGGSSGKTIHSNDDSEEDDVEKKIISAMNKPLAPYEERYFTHPWMWSASELTCTVVEYYEVGNVGAPCTRLFTATVGRSGKLLSLELPKKWK